MALTTTREVLNIFWPMTIPAYARFSIVSPFPLTISHPHNVSFILTLGAPILLSSRSPVHVIPSDVLSTGFAHGWSTLPTKLKLAILRRNIMYPSAIWPGNANTAMRKSLFPYLRMTPETAYLSRYIYFAENTFGLVSGEEEASMRHGFPPVSVRPLMRKLKLMMWLVPYDWDAVKAIARKADGSVSANLGAMEEKGADFWNSQLELRLSQRVDFESDGIIGYERLRSGRGEVDHRLLEQAEGLVKERFKFGVREWS